MELRPLGKTGLQVSPLGLGTVKFGRNQQVKYPQSFTIPDDRQISNLLALAADLGINLLDTAPAYGSSEERLGRLRPGRRDDWVLISKVGESFVAGQSHFDFSPKAIVASVHQSLQRLRTDYLDAVLLHSDGQDVQLLTNESVLETLAQLKQQGLIRATGISSKTIAGGLLAVQHCDLLMVTYQPPNQEEQSVIQAAHQAEKGILIKKALQSGHLNSRQAIEQMMRCILAEPGVSSIVIGTINPEHLRANVAMVQANAPTL